MPNPANANADLGGHNLLNAAVINSALTFAHTEWDAAHAYTPNEVVYDSTAKAWYQCIANNTNQEPPNATYWTAIATSDNLIYYGKGIYSTDVGNPETDVVQIRAVTSITSLCLGGAIATTGTFPGAAPNDYTPGANFAMGGAFLTDCNACMSTLGTMTACEESASIGCDGTVTHSFQAIGLGATTGIIYGSKVIAGAGGGITGPNDGARITCCVALGDAASCTGDHSIALGHSVTASAANAICVGHSITNSTSDSIALGVTTTAITITSSGATIAFNGNVNAQTNTTYTLALSDAGNEVTCSNAGAIAVTIPANATIAFPVGTRIQITQIAAGAVTLTAATGVTLKGFSPANGAYSYTSAVGTNAKTAGQEASLVIKKMATDSWRCFGAP